MSREGWATAAACLRVEEAELVAGLLASAGIEAEVHQSGAAGVLPVQGLGGAEIVVREQDLVRAREIVAASGVAGPPPRWDVEEIPDSEWMAPALPEPTNEERVRAAEAQLRFREKLWLGRSRPTPGRGRPYRAWLVSALIGAVAALLRACS